MNHPITTEQQIGQLLHGVRKAKTMTQAQLALQLGLTQTRLSRMELNPGRMTVAQLLNVLNVLGLTLHIENTSQIPEKRMPDQGEW